MEGGEQRRVRRFSGLVVVGGGGGVESDYSACPCQDGLSGNPVYIS